MTQPGSVARRRVLRTVRAVAASVLVWLGGTFAAGSYLAMHWELRPISGEPERPVVAGMYALLGLASIAVPSLAWWFLLPSVRWLGSALTAVWALAFFVLVMGFL